MLKKRILGKHILFLIGFALCFLTATNAYAACSNPAGEEGKNIYNTTHKTMQFCDGTDWWSMKSGGATSSGGGPTGVQVFTTSGTWTKPAGVTKVIVEVVGGGGGSGDGFTSMGGGGGYAKKLITSGLGATETVTVGIGGYRSQNGATSSFGAHASATGGKYDGACCGSGSGGDINLNGGSTTGVAGGGLGTGDNNLYGGGSYDETFRGGKGVVIVWEY